MKLLEELFGLVVTLLVNLFRLLFELIELIIKMIWNEKRGYDAKFIGQNQILSRWAEGFCLTGRQCLSVKNSFRNVLVLGSTGTGKTSTVLIPSIFKMKEHSLVIHDPSQEIHSYTAGYLASQGYNVKLLNFSDVNSVKYNPLQRIKSKADINKVASMLIRNTLGASRGDPFWNLQATGILVLLISILKEQPKEYQNLANLRHLINRFASEPQSLDALFIRTNDEPLFEEYRSIIAMESKVLSNVLATAKASLVNVSDETILKVTSGDELDFSRFREEKTALFISNPVIDRFYYSTATSILLEQLFAELLGKLPTQNSRSVFFLIDEAPVLFMPSLSTVISNVRKFSIGIMLLCQSFEQLHEKYGIQDAENIRSNCFAQMYFPGQNLNTTRELEQILGKLEDESDKGGTIIRPLMTADQIRTMTDNSALLICSNHRPIKLHLYPYYKQWRLSRYSRIPVPSPTTPDTGPVEIPIIPLNKPTAQ